MSGPSVGWESDGVGLGGQYLSTSQEAIYAAVLERAEYAECAIWTPGCGFSPSKTTHESVEEAKAHAEQQLRLLDPTHFARVQGGQS